MVLCTFTHKMKKYIVSEVNFSANTYKSALVLLIAWLY